MQLLKLILCQSQTSVTSIWNPKFYHQTLNWRLSQEMSYQFWEKSIINFEFKNESVSLEFLIAQISCQTVIGLPACQDLEVVKRVFSVSKSKSILDEFNNVFIGLGCLPNEYISVFCRYQCMYFQSLNLHVLKLIVLAYKVSYISSFSFEPYLLGSTLYYTNPVFL